MAYLRILLDTHDTDRVLHTLLDSIRRSDARRDDESRVKLTETRRRIVEQVQEQTK